jgi:phage antirepressor YoqD-like protein
MKTPKEIIENRDISKFLKLKRKDLIEFLHSYGITTGRITGKYVKNMDQTDLRHLAMHLIKEQRELQH